MPKPQQTKNAKLLKKVAVALKKLREERGLTQMDVYDETSIHIGRIETSKCNLTISSLAVLCDFYEIKLSDFFKTME